MEAELTEGRKDAIAQFVHRVWAAYRDGDPWLWRGGRPEDRVFEELLAECGGDPESAEFQYAAPLFDATLARVLEGAELSGPDPVLGRIDTAKARGELTIAQRGRS